MLQVISKRKEEQMTRGLKTRGLLGDPQRKGGLGIKNRNNIRLIL